MNRFFLLATVAVISVNLSFTHFIAAVVKETHSFMKIIQPNSQTDKDYWRKFVRKLNLVSIAKNKDPSISVKIDQTFYNAICLISAEWMSGFDLFNMSFLSSVFLMDILDILYYNSLNLKNRITKIEQNIRKYFWGHQRFWKIFIGPSMYA